MASITEALVSGASERVKSSVKGAKDHVVNQFDPRQSIYQLGLGIGPLIRETVSQYNTQQKRDSKKSEEGQTKKLGAIEKTGNQSNKSLQSAVKQLSSMNSLLGEIRRLNIAQLKLQTNAARISRNATVKPQTNTVGGLLRQNLSQPSTTAENPLLGNLEAKSTAGIGTMMGGALAAIIESPIVLGAIGAAIVNSLRKKTGIDEDSKLPKVQVDRRNAARVGGTAGGAWLGSKVFGALGHGKFGAIAGGIGGYLMGEEYPEEAIGGASLLASGLALSKWKKFQAARQAAVAAQGGINPTAVAAGSAPNKAAELSRAERKAASKADNSIAARQAAMEREMAENIAKSKMGTPTPNTLNQVDVPAYARKGVGVTSDWMVKGPGANPNVVPAATLSATEKMTEAVAKTAAKASEAATTAYGTVAKSATKVAAGGLKLVKGGAIGGLISGGFDYYAHGDAKGAAITAGLNVLLGGLGGIAGGALGSLIMPGAGTVGGAVAGNLAGGLAADYLSNKINTWRNPEAYGPDKVEPTETPAGDKKDDKANVNRPNAEGSLSKLKWGDLSPAQQEALLSAQQNAEGYSASGGPNGKGTRSYRNNNPGNIEYGNFAVQHGAVGSDGRFAIFKTYADGRAAQKALWDEGGPKGSKYKNLSIEAALKQWHGEKSGQQKINYENQIAKAIGQPTTVANNGTTNPNAAAGATASADKNIDFSLLKGGSFTAEQLKDLKDKDGILAAFGDIASMLPEMLAGTYAGAGASNKAPADKPAAPAQAPARTPTPSTVSQSSEKMTQLITLARQGGSGSPRYLYTAS